MKKMVPFFGALCASAMLAAAAPATPSIPWIAAPALDGKLDDAAWGQAWKGQLVDIQSGKQPAHPTAVLLGRDQDNLYIAFDCSEPEPAKIKRQFTHIEERDNAIYSDDCVEILLDPLGADTSAGYHFAVNSAGIFYDALAGNPAFDSHLKAVCRTEADRWIAEVAIPFADLGVTPGGAELLKINLGRERQAVPAEYSCLKAGPGGFSDESHFIAFRPAAQDGKLPPVTFMALGSGAAPKAIFANTLPGKQTFRVALEFLDADHQAFRKFNLKTKPGVPTEFEYRLSDKKPPTAIRLSVAEDKDNGRELYANVFELPKAARSVRRTLTVERPLFDSLLSQEAKPDFGFAGFQWMFGIGEDGGMSTFALQYGLPYSGEDYARENKATGMANLTNSVMIDWANAAAHGDKNNIPLAVMPRPLQENVKSGLPYALSIVPEIQKMYLDEVRKLASGKNVKALYIGDEMSECIEIGLIKAFRKFPGNPELQAIDAEIKAKYGQDKYGIPASLEMTDPLGWIAYRRWLNAAMVKLFHEAYRTAKAANPAIVVIAEDPAGHQTKIYGFADWKGSFDIVTHQLYPRGSQYVDSFGFLTKYLTDLTGAKDVWPCPHIEEYGATFTPDEVLDKLSSSVRCGATGFHYYLSDTTGRRGGKKYMVHEYWGAPDRYQVEIAAQKKLAAMPRLQYPAPDAAVFTATDSLRAQPGIQLKVAPEFDIHLHGFMGYGAGVWYRFINELTLNNLQQYKFIATVENEYADDATLNALKQYVEAGGTLLVLNPFAFSFTPEGQSLDAVRAAFTGIAAVKKTSGAQLLEYQGKNLPASGLPTGALTPAPGAKVIGKLDDGNPGMVEYSLGKGKVITLAVNPCVRKLAGSKPWTEFFHQFAVAAGCRADQDIWRFKLPDALVQKLPLPAGQCLTNNAVIWRQFQPLQPNNAGTGGTYTLTPEPDSIKDRASGAIAFDQGKLTDRPRAIAADSAYGGKGNWQEWVIGYKTSAPIAIDCRWEKPMPVAAVKFWVQGAWRDAKIIIGSKTYEFPCDPAAAASSNDIREITLALPEAVAADQLTVQIAGMAGSLVIAEMEIWTK